MSKRRHVLCVIQEVSAWGLMTRSGEKRIVARGADLNSVDSEKIPVQMLAMLKTRHGEIIVTDEGFQGVEFNLEFEGIISFHVREDVTDAPWIHLISPRSGSTYAFELDKTNLVHGDHIQVKMILKDLLHEAPRN